MITECLAQKKPFGVCVPPTRESPTSAAPPRFVSVTKKYDDGRMDILTRGVERFEVLK